MKGRILIFNEAASKISGYSIDEALTSLNIRDFYPAEGAREIMRKLRSKEYGGKGKVNSCEVNYKRKDGAIFMIRLSAAIVYSGDQEVASVGFFYDLRDRMEMERKLEKTRIQLLQAEKMSSLGKLAAGVAHQLNNPLGGITLYAQLMMEEYPLEDAAREDLKRIIDDAERCRNTVRELLEFARQTRQEIRLNDLNHAISRTLFLLENQSLFHNIEIIKSLDPDLPKVPSDIQQLNHVGRASSHITAPALHRSAEEVRDLFIRHGVIPPDEKPPADRKELARWLSLAARRKLAPLLRDADLGITGANFLVAETGTVVLVENEGTSASPRPRRGPRSSWPASRRSSPRLTDLGTLLPLLTRSATGQRISAYVSLISGPIAADLTVVLLDAGRVRTLADPLGREILRCIRCGVASSGQLAPTVSQRMRWLFVRLEMG